MGILDSAAKFLEQQKKKVTSVVQNVKAAVTPTLQKISSTISNVIKPKAAPAPVIQSKPVIQSRPAPAPVIQSRPAVQNTPKPVIMSTPKPVIQSIPTPAKPSILSSLTSAAQRYIGDPLKKVTDYLGFDQNKSLSNPLETQKSYLKAGGEVLNAVTSYPFGGAIKAGREVKEGTYQAPKTGVTLFGKDLGERLPVGLVGAVRGIKQKQSLMEETPRAFGVDPKSYGGLAIGLGAEILAPGPGGEAKGAKKLLEEAKAVKSVPFLGKAKAAISRLFGKEAPRIADEGGVLFAKAAEKTIPDETALLEKQLAQRTGKILPKAASSSVPTQAELKAVEQGFDGTSNKIVSQVENPQDPYFNVNKLNVSDDSKAGLAKVIEESKPLIEEKVGRKLSNKEAVDFANGTSSVLNRAISRDETLQWEARMLKARQQLAAQAESGTVTKEYLDNLLAIKSQGTDIARKLQSLGIGADPVAGSAKEAILEAVLRINDNADEILKAAEGVDFNDLNQATEFYRRFVAPKASEWLDLFRYNSMLSSPNTHIANIASNFQGAGLIAPIEKTLLGGVDFLKSKITGSKRQYYAGEGAAYAKAFYSNLHDASQNFASVMRGEKLSGNLDIRNLPLTTGGRARKVENVLALPTKLLEGMDQFFTTLTQAGEKAGLEYRVSKGTKVGNLDIQALQAAQKRLFRGDLSPKEEGYVLNALDSGAQAIYNLRNSSNPLVSLISKFTFPFIKTPINVLKQGVEYSPIGFTTLFGAKNKTEQLTKALMGTSIGISTAMLVGSDRLTWAEPTDPSNKNLFRASGRIPYAIKIGDRWVSYSKLHPAIAFNLALTAAIKDSLDKQTLDEGQAETVLEGLSKWVQFFADQSYMKNMGDFLASAKGDLEGPARYLSGYPQQLIPFRALLGWVTRIVDPVQRQVDTDGNILMKQLQQIATQIPFLSELVPARLGPDGQPIKTSLFDRAINAFSPARTSTSNPEMEEIYRNTQEASLIRKDTAVVKDQETKRMTPIYEQVQALKNAGRIDEATQIVNGLSDEDYKIYKSIKDSAQGKESTFLEKQMYSTVKDIQELMKQGREVEAKAIIDKMTDEEYAAYKSAKKALTPPKQSAVPGKSTIAQVGAFAKKMNPFNPPSAAAGDLSYELISGTPAPYANMITEASSKHGVPSSLLSALLKQESGFNPNAKSPVGASGIAQFMPETARQYGVNPLDPSSAIDGAARLLRDEYKRFGSWELALAAYNAGAGAVQKYGGIPPFEETQNYVRKIMGMMGSNNTTTVTNYGDLTDPTPEPVDKFRNRNIELALGLEEGQYRKGLRQDQGAIDRAFRSNDPKTIQILREEGLKPSSDLNPPVQEIQPAQAQQLPEEKKKEAAGILVTIQNLINTLKERYSFI